MRKRILIVDDHAIVRRGWRQLIDSEPDLMLCGAAANATEALDAMSSVPPDLLMVDLSLKGTGGLDLTKQARTQYPDMPILVVSMYEPSIYADRCRKAGASAYLSKRQSNDELLTVIRALLATSAADGGAEKLKRLNADDDSRVSQLTDREFETLILIGQGLAPRHVADRMHLSVNTIEAHRQQLKEKLQLESAAELSRFAVSWLRNHRENRSDGPYQPTDDESPESPISRQDD